MTISTARLHFNKRETTLVVPLYITGLVALVSVLISLLYWRAGSLPGTDGWIEGSQANPGIAYSLAGFLGYLGVQSVATTFPFALTLGETRRGFAWGTVLWSAGVSAYLTLVLAVLLVLEGATDRWFVGFYIFDVHVLGAGDLGLLIPTVFLGTWSVLSIGGAFGASWIRYGARGPQALAVAVVVVLVLGLMAALPASTEILAAFEMWWIAVAAVVVIAIASIGTWLLLRSATVR